MQVLAALLRPQSREQIRRPADIAGLLMVDMAMLDQEELRAVLLDTKSRVQDIVTVYKGSLNSAEVRVDVIFKADIRQNSASVIIAHNHPSHDPAPSPEDIVVTQRLIEASVILNVPLLDHLVIGG